MEPSSPSRESSASTEPSPAEAAAKTSLLARLGPLVERLRPLLARLATKEPGMAAAYLLIPLAAAPRIWTVYADQGVFWPDEIYQTVEQAHRLVFGYGMVPWEFRDGARSWVFPGMLAAVLKVASWLGLRTGPELVHTVRLFMAAMSVWGVYATMKLARILGSNANRKPPRAGAKPWRMQATDGRYAALLAGAMAALLPCSLVYGSRCMTEMISAPFLVTAAWLALVGGRWRELLAGALAGIAIYFRYQNGLFAVGLLVALAASRRWKDGLYYGLSSFTLGMAGGYLDKLTWGEWFHSFIVYVKFNLIEGKASGWGVADFDYYAKTLWTSTGWPLVVLLLGVLLVFPRAIVLTLTVAAYIGAHNAVPHKEYRFLMPIMPALVALASGGLGWLLEKLPRVTLRPFAFTREAAGSRPLGGWLATAMAMALGLFLAHKSANITFEEMGQSVGSPDGQWPPWNHEEGPNLCFWEAGQHNDLCGIIMVGTPLISTGGYTYLHKNVPILSMFDLSATNYAAYPEGYPPPPGYRVVATFPAKSLSAKTYYLLKRDGGCTPPPPWFVQAFP